MRNARLRVRAKLAWWGGFFCLGFSVLWFMNAQGRRIWQYHAEHGWPVVSAVVKNFSPHSRTDLKKRNGFYVPVYWMEYTVALNLHRGQCPLPMRITLGGISQCVGTYTTVWTDSEEENWHWGSRHPLLSTVQVRYDPTGKSGPEVFFAEEAPKHVYPWGYVFGALFAVFLSGLCFLSAKWDIAEAERWEAEFPDQQGYESRDNPASGSAFSDNGQIVQLNLSGKDTQIQRSE